MRIAAKTLLLTVCAALTILVLLAGLRPPPPAPALSADDNDTPPETANTRQQAAAAPLAAGSSDAGKYFFDLVHHSAEEFAALMERAHSIYEQTPAEQRRHLSIVLVIHGPDIDFFRRDNYAEYQSLVDSAARLDAFGVFDFKVCSRTAANRGIGAEDLPDFVEFVPYGPQEIADLKAGGYMRL